MIATRRGIAILGVLALLALVLVLVDRPRGRTTIDRALVAGLDVSRVTSLRWEDAGKPVLSIVRAPDAPRKPAPPPLDDDEPANGSGAAVPSKGASGAATERPAANEGTWKFVAPAYGTVDRAAMSNLLAALRGARWHRRENASVAGASTHALVINDGARAHVVRFGRTLEGGEQAWLVVDGHALLVDAWVARALDPGALAIAMRRPFEGAERGSIRIGDMTLSGQPRSAYSAPWARVVVSASIATEAEQALAGLEVQQLVADAMAPPATKPALAPDPAPTQLELRAGNVHGVLGGECPGAPQLVLLRASTGGGCVTAEAADRVRVIAAKLAGPPSEIVDQRLAPVEPLQITLADGGVLDLRKRALINGAPADPTRVAELLAVLAAPAELTPTRPPENKARGRITIEHAGGTFVLELFADRLVSGPGGGLFFRLSPTAWDLLAQPSRAFRELALWSEEPTTLTRMDLDGVTYQRGAVVGEWTRTPAGATDSAKLEALATELAAPRPIAPEAPAFTARHRVSIVITPPTGAPTTHVLEIGAPATKGCPARADGTAVFLARATCDAITALAR